MPLNASNAPYHIQQEKAGQQQEKAAEAQQQSRLLAKWAFRHPVDGHIIEKF